LDSLTKQSKNIYVSNEERKRQINKQDKDTDSAKVEGQETN